MRNTVSQLLIALIAISISHAMALPLAAQPALRGAHSATADPPPPATCAATLTFPDTPCTCLSNCTATASCCSDFGTFSHQVLGPYSIHPPPTDAYYELLDFGQADRVPEFYKIEPALTGLSRLPNARGALVTVRTCLMEDVNRATNANGKDRKWVVNKCVRAFDVVGARAGDGKVVKVTDLVRVPKQVRAAFAPAHNVTAAAAYYAPLEGEGAVNAYKVALTLEPLLAGFSGTLRRGAKYTWDPTSGRKWRVEKAQFTGTTQPIEAAIPESDVSAEQVDRDLQGVFDMSRGQIASTSDVLVKVWDAKRGVWVTTVDEQGNRKVACELAA